MQIVALLPFLVGLASAQYPIKCLLSACSYTYSLEILQFYFVIIICNESYPRNLTNGIFRVKAHIP